MAVKETSNPNASGRRLFFGTNVALMVFLAAFVLVAVNWLAHAKNSRADLSGGLSGHRLSDRTKKILDKAGDDLRITTVYASDLPGSARKEFFPKVEDLAEEIREYKHSVKIDHITGGDEQAALRKRIQEKFGGAASKYDEVIALSGTIWDELKQSLQPQRDAIAAIINSDSWLSGFSTLANIAALLQKDIKAIDDTRREVDGLVHGEGLPRYQEANNKIRDFDNDLKKHMEQAQNWMSEMDKLAKELGNPEGEFRKSTDKKLQELNGLTGELKKAAGDPSDPNIPADPKPVLQEFAKTALDLSAWLNAESRRVDEFTGKFPAIRQYPQWQIHQSIFVMELPSILNSTAEDLGNNSREIRRILQTADVPLDQLQNVIRKLREIASAMETGLAQWRDGITAVLDQGLKIDAQSKEFLAKGSAGDLFGKPLERIGEVLKKITELPELKLDEIAQRLQQDNIVVVERGDQVKVVSFDEAWPIADPTGGMRAPDEGSTARVFDADTGISNALLAMTQDKPVAKVVLVTFEDQPPPQMRQFQRPMTGPIPFEAVKVLRDKLEGMQFKVEQWNIAEEGAMEKAPKADEGVPLIHVFLPPPPAPPPFMRQQQEQQKTFKPSDAEVARRVLAQNGRGLFLATWMPPMRFGPPSEYGWSPILTSDWGVKVEPDKRVIRGVVDRKEPGRFAIDFVQIQWMQLSNFTSQPIGFPLRARRMLMTNVCPVSIEDKLPQNVTATPILEVPKDATDLWAEGDIEPIANAIQTGAKESTFTKSDKAVDPPFDVAVAAENSANKSKIVVLGNGVSLRDDYLQQRVFRLGGKGARLVTDPPPIENIDLAANALYWLADRPDLIAAGPAEVPVVGPLEPGKRRAYWLVTFAWAAAALVVGGAMWVVRRK